MRVDVWVSGEPKGQPRARATRRGGHVGMYTPDTAKEWRKAIADALEPMVPTDPIEGPVEVEMKFYFSRPQRLNTSRSLDGEIPHIKKPDKDNLEKAVLDECVKVGLIRDDCQVWASDRIEKVYVCKGGTPGMMLTVRDYRE